MNGPSEVVLALGALAAAAASGALLARAARLPPAAGALAAGAVAGLSGLTLRGEAAWPAEAFACAWLCLLLGMELDARALAHVSSFARPHTLAHGALVVVLGGAAARTAGLPLAAAIVAALCLLAGSPLATVAVTAESSARGPLTRELQSASSITFLAGLAAAALAAGSTAWRPWACVALGAMCGAVLLIPLSRTVTRAGLLLVTGMACALILMVSTWLGGELAWIALLSLCAGLVAGHLTPRSGAARMAMRDLCLPPLVFWFALFGARLDRSTLAAGALGGVLLAVARAGAAFVPGASVRAAPTSWLRPLASAPTSAGIVALAVAGGPERSSLVAMLLVATSLTEAVGMAAARSVLAGAREAVPLTEAPDAWRATMR